MSSSPTTPGAHSDTDWAAFTEVGPWDVKSEEVRWVHLAATLRSQGQAEVPLLTKPSKLPPGARVISVSARLGQAIAPWLIAKKRGKFDTPEASRAVISRRLRKAA